MWVGKCVQRAARNHDRPRGNVFRRGEPTSNEYANADENEPKRVVDVGGRSPGATAKRGYPLGVAVVKTDGAAAPHVEKCRQTSRNAALAEGSRALRGAPKDSFIVRWRSVATKGKQKFAYKASSLVNQVKSTTVDRPTVGLMVPIYERRSQDFLRP